MKIAILGFGSQGKSVYQYLSGSGDQITVLDKQAVEGLPEGVESRFGQDYLSNLNQYDLIFRSPGIHPRDIVEANTEDILNKVTSNTNRFFEDSPSKNIIGVTGTKGKGTTSTLIAELLKSLGKKVHLGGNIGIPPLDLISNGIAQDDWVVLELANYQLIDLKYSPHIALCLLVEPEHLDWHENENEYYEAKKQLFKRQTDQDIAIYYADNPLSKEIGGSGAGKLVPYFAEPGAIVRGESIYINNQEVVKTNELQLLGKHNYQNVCAALTTVWQLEQNLPAYSQAIKDFKPLPFRLELRKEINGVKFYNDSFSSAPTSAIAAIEAIPGKKVVILGGKDRGLDLGQLCQVVKDSDVKALLIGMSAHRIADSLKSVGFNNFEMSDAKDMNSIVWKAKEMADIGDSVILSPGFPSFDMFANFEDRGLRFNRAVEKL